MTTAAAQRNRATTPNSTGGVDTALDRRRDKWQIAVRTATGAETHVAALGKKLDTNAKQHSEHESALQEALDRQAEHKTALKALDKECDRLRAARKKADRDAETARQHAQAAEGKYDKALLADMLRQQKNTDISAHTGGAKRSTPRTTSRSSGTATRRKSAPASSRRRSTTKTSTVARSTARRTAATVTARKARS